LPLPLYSELKRRRVFRALVGYGIAAFAVLQIIEPVVHGMHWPDAVVSYVVVALAVGFPIVVTLAWIFDVGAAGIERTPPSASVRGPRLTLVLVGIGLLAAAPGLIWYFAVRGRPRAVAAVAPSIAVLPFADMSPAKDQEYFSDGVAEEILDALAQVEGLRVAGRTSSFSFKGKSEDLRSIGEKLNVGTILEGSVRKEGNQVRITAQLVNATDGFHLWSETYNRELTGVFAAQDEISRAVVDALKLRLMPAQQPRRRTANPEVYNEYLLGKQFFHRLTLDNYRRAAAAFERALALDPGFAPAWAGLGMATFWVADVADTTAQISAGYERALAAAEKAVALDPGQVDGYAARGFLRSAIRWDWEGARSDFERALALNPGVAENHQRHAVAVLAPLGRLRDAIREAQKATELDPLSAIAWSSLGRLYWIDGQLGPAQAALERSLRILPEQNYAASNLAITLLLQKRPLEALAAAELSTHDLFRTSGKAMALHDLGRTDEARRLAEEMVTRWADGGAFQIAETYAWFGDRERAFQWLDRAYAQHDSGLPYLRSDALLRSLHGDPRFAALLRNMKLPPE